MFTRMRNKNLTLLVIISIISISLIYYFSVLNVSIENNGWLGHSDHHDHLHFPSDLESMIQHIPRFSRLSDRKTFLTFEDQSTAIQLAREVRILCWVMTNPSNHEAKAIHIKKTWGTRCNVLLFMSSEQDDEIPTVGLNVSEGRDHLWYKVRAALTYIYDNHRNDAEWFFRADDDTYVVVENARLMLSAYDPQDPLYFGCRFKPFVKQGYMSGGAGYVLSRSALDKLVTVAFPSPELCKQEEEENDDVEIAICLENVGVKIPDSRDRFGRARFLPLAPGYHLYPGTMDKDFWFWDYTYYKAEEGPNCCSDNAISFHYIEPDQMYIMDYLIYRLHPFGVEHKWS